MGYSVYKLMVQSENWRAWQRMGLMPADAESEPLEVCVDGDIYTIGDRIYDIASCSDAAMLKS